MKALSSQVLLSLLLLVIATFHHVPLSSAATVWTEAPAPAPTTVDFIRSVCNITEEDVDVCYSSISPYADVINQNVNTLCRVGLALAQSEARHVATYVSGLRHEAKTRFDHVISVCNFTLGHATDRISDSLGTIGQIAAGKGDDFKSEMFQVLTEMSAALTYETTCVDEFQEEPDGPVKKKIVDLVTESKKFTGIALAFVNYYSKKGSP